MAASVSLELDPIFLKGLGYLHSKSKDSAEKLKALLDESLSRGSDSTYRSLLKEAEVSKVSLPKLAKQDSKSTSSSSSSSSSLSISSSKSSSTEKSKKEAEKRPAEKVRVESADASEPLKKPRVEKLENRSSPLTFLNKDLSDFSYSDETNADDFAMEMGLVCVVCRQMTVSSGNQLVECQECHNLYHQECHRPPVSDKDVNDPRLVWYCARCTRQMKRMAQKTQKPPQKSSPTVTSSMPAVKDPMVKKPELKTKPDTPGSFQAFKRTELKTSSGVAVTTSIGASSLPSGSGLTGWAAFTKTSSTTSSGSKPGLNKPAGLYCLGTKTQTGGGNGNSGSGTAVPLKPPPPLTLGKPSLSRSSSSENPPKSGSLSPGASASGGAGNGATQGSNSGASGNNGGNNGNGAAKISADGKTPTSQESQINAMKRLQLVKKKAAQRKMKK